MVNEKPVNNRLGVDRSSLGKLRPQDLKTAATANAVLSYLSSVETENAELKIKVETQQTYVSAYDLSQNNAKIAAFLSLISTIAASFSINLFTSDNNITAAIVLLVIGIALQVISIILAFRK